MKVVIIDYGAGNTRSVQFALERLGISPELTANIETISKADRVIFPGVGEASNAMKNLSKTNVDQLLPELKQPVLGICLGMQLMCSHSDENNTKGLGIFEDTVIRFNETVKVPQIGWNTINSLASPLFDTIDSGSYMYAVHSYYVPKSNAAIALSDYGGTYTAALRKDNFYGVQFHPEKSGKGGALLLENFIKKCE